MECLVPSLENASHPSGPSTNVYSLAASSRFLPPSHLLAPTDLSPFCTECSLCWFTSVYFLPDSFLGSIGPCSFSSQHRACMAHSRCLISSCFINWHRELKEWERATSATVKVGLNKKECQSRHYIWQAANSYASVMSTCKWESSRVHTPVKCSSLERAASSKV